MLRHIIQVMPTLVATTLADTSNGLLAIPSLIPHMVAFVARDSVYVSMGLRAGQTSS